jgi:hypothetical protein
MPAGILVENQHLLKLDARLLIELGAPNYNIFHRRFTEAARQGGCSRQPRPLSTQMPH